VRQGEHIRQNLAEWHNMCADRDHAGIKKWSGMIPPESKDQPGSSGSRDCEIASLR
jgi:hypothetical protein